MTSRVPSLFAFVFPSYRSLSHVLLPSTGRLLAVDWGEVRIGLALSDESQILATPLETLVRRPGKRFPMPRLARAGGRARPGRRGGRPAAHRRRAEEDERRSRPASWPTTIGRAAPACRSSCGTSG